MGNPLPQSIDRHQLRTLLELALETDSDLDAFCLDFFPTVHKRISNGMDRLAKVNLLLDLGESTSILTTLRKVAPGEVSQWEQLLIEHVQSRAQNPYRGLNAFRMEDSNVFCGRAALTEKLWLRYQMQLANGPRLLTILGPSGSGKSSVAHAGFLVRFQREHPDLNFAILRPGPVPIRELAISLCQSHTGAHYEVDRLGHLIDCLLNPNAKGVYDRLTLFCAAQPAAPKLLLIDQLEEIYTQCDDRTQRDAFVNLLVHASCDPVHPIFVVLTMRSDFLGETQRYHPKLSRLMAATDVIVPALSRSDLRDAIAVPARHARRPLDEATVELLVREAEGSAGALPLLEFALTRIFVGLVDGIPASETLQQLGGIGGALAYKAREIYQALTVSEQQIARRALVRLARLGEGERDTRCRVALRDLCGRGTTPDQVLAVLRRFSEPDARLVTLLGDTEDTRAEVTHEALFQHWTELREWIVASRVDRRFLDRVSESVTLWKDSANAPGRLWRPPDLDLLKRFEKRSGGELSDAQMDFLRASNAQIATEHRNKSKAMVAGLGLVLVALMALAFGIAQQRQAKEVFRQKLLDSYVERGRQLLVEQEEPSEAALWLLRTKTEGSRDPALSFLLEEALHPIEVIQQTLVHHSNLNDAVFSPDGHSVITASSDGVVRKWEAQSGRLIREFKGPSVRVFTARYSSDGRRIITANEDLVARVWDADQGQLLLELRGHGERVNSAVFSPDGRLALTASGDGSAGIWDLAKGQMISQFRGHKGWVSAAAFSPDGNWLVTAGQDHTARIWEARSGRLLRELSGHQEEVRAASFSPNGRQVVTASRDQTVQIREADSGRLIREFRGHQGWVNSVAYSADGLWLVTASSDGMVRIWEVESGGLVQEFKGPQSRVFSANFSPDGRQVVTASEDLTARIWTTDQGRLMRELRGHDERVNSASFSPNGRLVVTAGGDRLGGIWDSVTGQLVRKLWGHEEWVSSASFSPDGDRVITASKDNTARIWDAASGRELSVLRGHTAEVKSASFSPNGRLVVTASRDRSVFLWDIASGRVVWKSLDHEARVNSAQFSPDGRRIVTASTDGTSRILETDSGKTLRVIRGNLSGMNSASFSPNGKIIVTANEDQTARIWDSESGLLLRELRSHQARVNSAVFSPDGRWVVTASASQVVRLWEAETGRLVRKLVGHAGEVCRAEFSSDGKWVLTASKDKTARLWDITTTPRLLNDMAALLQCHLTIKLSNDMVAPTVPDIAACEKVPALPSSPPQWSDRFGQFHKGLLAWRRGQHPEARTLFRQSRILFERWADSEGLAKVSITEAIRDDGSLDAVALAQIERLMQKARMSDDEQAKFFDTLALLAQEELYSPTAAGWALQQAIRLRRDDPRRSINLLEIHLAEGRLLDVLRDGEGVIRIQPKDAASRRIVIAGMMWVAARLAHDRRTERSWASRTIQEYLQLDPNLDLGWTAYGLCHALEQRQMPKAELDRIKKLFEIFRQVKTGDTIQQLRELLAVSYKQIPDFRSTAGFQ